MGLATHQFAWRLSRVTCASNETAAVRRLRKKIYAALDVEGDETIAIEAGLLSPQQATTDQLNFSSATELIEATSTIRGRPHRHR